MRSFLFRLARPIFVGTITSGVILSLVGVHQVVQFNTESGIERFPCGHSFADFGQWLSGVAGALAFVWIVITYMRQADAMHKQAEEIAHLRKEADKRAMAEYRHHNLLERDVVVKTAQLLRQQQLHCCQLIVERLRRERGTSLSTIIDGVTYTKALPSLGIDAGYVAMEFVSSILAMTAPGEETKYLWSRFILKDAQTLIQEAQTFVNIQMDLEGIASHVGMKPYFEHDPFAGLAKMLRALTGHSIVSV